MTSSLKLDLNPLCIFNISYRERKPLSPKARRAGWVGCNILLGRIPADAKIKIGKVTDVKLVSPRCAKNMLACVRLKDFPSENRGWTLDVLNAVRGLGKSDFALSDVYALESSLAQLYPHNRHVRDKIRQQLQVLRIWVCLYF